VCEVASVEGGDTLWRGLRIQPDARAIGAGEERPATGRPEAAIAQIGIELVAFTGTKEAARLLAHAQIRPLRGASCLAHRYIASPAPSVYSVIRPTLWTGIMVASQRVSARHIHAGGTLIAL
jgi:hypothetical protein